MLEKTKLNHVQRATETLRGIVAGLVADYELNDSEITRLVDWLSIHSDLLDRSPFKDLNVLLNRVLEDQVIDEDERVEIMEWCREFSDPSSHSIQNITTGIRRLHGFLQGIAMDGVITDSEIDDLADWLHDHENVREYWPFDDVWDLLDRIRADGKITEDERREVKDLCDGFAEVFVARSEIREDRDKDYQATTAPFLLSVEGIFESTPRIEFKSRLFCFTGNFVHGKRRDLHEIVSTLDGESKNHVSLDLDYLVVGTIGEPTWAYNVYGRKIESVKENQRLGRCKTIIVKEDDFIEAAKNASQ